MQPSSANPLEMDHYPSKTEEINHEILINTATTMAKEEKQQYKCLTCGATGKPGRYDAEEKAGICDDCRMASVTVTENITKLPSVRTRERIRKHGTQEQVAQLEALEKEHDVDAPSRELSDYERNYYASLPQEAPTDVDTQEISVVAQKFIHAKMGARQPRPKEITYELTRKIFWQYLKAIVQREHTGANPPEVVMGGNLPEVCKNFCHWLIGSPAGEWPTKKSLYLWGGLGVGKSTIALAGHYVLAFFRHHYKWDARMYNYVSMDEVFLQTYARQGLDEVGKLAKGAWCLDELRQEHFIYKHYGNEFAIMNDVLMARHKVWKRDNLKSTILTSNIPPVAKPNDQDDVPPLKVALNDSRLWDWMQQQYHFVLVTGPNYRKEI